MRRAVVVQPKTVRASAVPRVVGSNEEGQGYFGARQPAFDHVADPLAAEESAR